MQLEFHQLERRLEHLRAHRPERQQRLLAIAGGQWAAERRSSSSPRISPSAICSSMATAGQGAGAVGRDTVEAVVWSLSEAEALFLDARCAPASRPRLWKRAGCWRRCSERFGYDQEELARRFDRSVSWVSRRMGLVELLPAAVQQQGAQRRDHSPCGDEVPGAGGAVGRGRLLPHGGGLCAASAAQPRSGQLYVAWRGAQRRCANGCWPIRSCS